MTVKMGIFFLFYNKLYAQLYAATSHKQIKQAIARLWFGFYEPIGVYHAPFERLENEVFFCPKINHFLCSQKHILSDQWFVTVIRFSIIRL